MKLRIVLALLVTHWCSASAHAQVMVLKIFPDNPSEDEVTIVFDSRDRDSTSSGASIWEGGIWYVATSPGQTAVAGAGVRLQTTPPSLFPPADGTFTLSSSDGRLSATGDFSFFGGSVPPQPQGAASVSNGSYTYSTALGVTTSGSFSSIGNTADGQFVGAKFISSAYVWESAYNASNEFYYRPFMETMSPSIEPFDDVSVPLGGGATLEVGVSDFFPILTSSRSRALPSLQAANLSRSNVDVSSMFKTSVYFVVDEPMRLVGRYNNYVEIFTAVRPSGANATFTIRDLGASQSLVSNTTPGVTTLDDPPPPSTDIELTLSEGQYSAELFMQFDDATVPFEEVQSLRGLLDLSFEAASEPCLPDLVGMDGVLDIDDVLAFLNAFASEDPAADLASPSGVWNIDDVLQFLQLFAAGCP